MHFAVYKSVSKGWGAPGELEISLWVADPVCARFLRLMFEARPTFYSCLSGSDAPIRAGGRASGSLCMAAPTALSVVLLGPPGSHSHRWLPGASAQVRAHSHLCSSGNGALRMHSRRNCPVRFTIKQDSVQLHVDSIVFSLPFLKTDFREEGGGRHINLLLTYTFLVNSCTYPDQGTVL